MTKIRMSAHARNAAKHLAIRFDAFNEACRDKRDSGIISWGFMLQSAQAETGIELIRDDILNALIDCSLRATAKPASEHLKTARAAA